MPGDIQLVVLFHPIPWLPDHLPSEWLSRVRVPNGIPRRILFTIGIGILRIAADPQRLTAEFFVLRFLCKMPEPRLLEAGGQSRI